MGEMRPWKLVWITGASSGIGREVALTLAREGVTVAVSARSRDKLDEMAALSSFIKPFPLDVLDEAACDSTVAEIERTLGTIDLAILNAGIWRQMTVKDYSAAGAKETMSVNYFGVVNALEPLMRSMSERGSGHIAVVSSVAGYRGMMKGAAYSPSKAALIGMCEALYPHLQRKGVMLTVINPGFVKTPMTDVNTFPMPFIVPVEDAARTIVSGLKRKKYEIVFPWRMALLMKTLRIMPNWLFFRLVSTAITKAGTGDEPLPPAT